MKPLRIVLTVLMCAALLAAEGLLMGLFSADTALSEKSIKKSMEETDIIEQLVDEAIAENTVNMGGIYGEFAKEVFRTEVMEDFFADYLISAVNTEVYGKPYEETAYDELTEALAQGVEEVSSSGKYDISPVEEELIIQAVKAEAPALTEAMDEQVNRYEAVSGSMTEEAVEPDELVSTMLSPAVKAALLIVCLALCIGIIALCRRSRLGFLWCGIVTLTAAAAYGVLSLMGDTVFSAAAGSSPSEQMVVSMITGGFTGAFAAGAAAAAVFFVVFAVMKIADRRKAGRSV